MPMLWERLLKQLHVEMVIVLDSVPPTVSETAVKHRSQGWHYV